MTQHVPFSFALLVVPGCIGGNVLLESDLSVGPTSDEPWLAYQAMYPDVPCSAEAVAFVDGANGYATLGEAIDAAPEGSVVTVCPGEYEDGRVLERSITLESSNGPDDTLLRSESNNIQLLMRTEGQETVIRGLSFTGEGDAVVAHGDGCFLQVTASIFSVFSESGSPIWNECSLLVSDSLFEANEAVHGGSIALNYTEAHVTNSVFRRNSRGGFDINESTVDADHVLLEGNTGFEGGVAQLWAGSLTLDASIVTANEDGDDDGAAVWLEAGSTLVSIGSAWGRNGDRNTPDDIYVTERDRGYTADVDGTFTCTEDGCVDE